MMCEVDGFPSPNFIWSKNSQSMSDQQSNQLILPSIEYLDAAEYGCVAINNFDSKSDKIKLEMVGECSNIELTKKEILFQPVQYVCQAQGPKNKWQG